MILFYPIKKYKEEREACNTWNPIDCPNPCDNVRCPAFAKCKNISTDTDPLFRCDCQLGTVKKEDGSACIAPQPQKVTVRPIPAISDTEKVKINQMNKGRSTLAQKVPKITVRWRLKYQNS